MTDKDLIKIYRKHLAPLHDTIAPAVAVARDPGASSYFMPILGKENVVAAEQFEDSLARLWTSKAMRDLIPVMKKLSKELTATGKDSGDVSELIYPMY